ncbi:MAG: hypothetical protein SGI97_10980 [candidate division Zixibacteria bacterium]|nr:hypothetical protein [candidate division Zixibacteria bacterium]
MDGPIDPAKKIPDYLAPGTVYHTHRAEKDKKRKFLPTLQEELEYEKKRKRKKEGDMIELSSVEEQSEQPFPEEPRHSTEQDDGEVREQTENNTSGHIDVQA